MRGSAVRRSEVTRRTVFARPGSVTRPGFLPIAFAIWLLARRAVALVA